jgi:hypothetical protein
MTAPTKRSVGRPRKNAKKQEFQPSVDTNLRNCDMSKMHETFQAWVKSVFPEATEGQITEIMFHAIRVYWMMGDWDKMPEPPCEPKRGCEE